MKVCNFESILISNILLENVSTLKNEKWISKIAFHLTLQDHEIKWYCDFTKTKPSSQGKYLRPAKFGGRRYCDSSDKGILVCHMIM